MILVSIYHVVRYKLYTGAHRNACQMSLNSTWPRIPFHIIYQHGGGLGLSEYTYHLNVYMVYIRRTKSTKRGMGRTEGKMM